MQKHKLHQEFTETRRASWRCQKSMIGLLVYQGHVAVDVGGLYSHSEWYCAHLHTSRDEASVCAQEQLKAQQNLSTVSLGIPVFVYRNLHQNTWSVRDRQSGRVIARADFVAVTDAEFRVGKAGRERVLREGRKNVHAGVAGTLSGISMVRDFAWNIRDPLTDVSYNPRVGPTFYTATDRTPVRKAERVYLSMTERSEIENTPRSRVSAVRPY